MGKIKNKAKLVEEEEELNPPIKLSSDDDEEANEDLTLKIVHKAMLRACGQNTQKEGAEVVTEVKKKKLKKVRKKTKRVITEDDRVVVEKETVIVEKEADKAEECKSLETDKLAEPEVNVVDNVVLRKLLRGPRYFDLPDSSWGTCYNCGDEGHMAVNCTSAKRTKPCFVCGSLEHNVKQCSKGKDCYICKKGGHRAKDCPEKKLAGGPQSSRLCLKCGESGHEMFLCRSDYSSDDLKEIQCYICKSFGHLCCVSYSGTAAGEVSCYRCGQTGHTGLACTKLRGESYGTGTPSSCYRCGEGGHFARECTSSVKTSKRNRELSTPKAKSWGQDGDCVKRKSLPFDLDMAHNDGSHSASSKAKHKNGWIRENSGEYSRIEEKQYRNSPLRPTNKNKKNYDSTAGGSYGSTPHSYSSARHHRFDYSASNDTIFYQHMHSASNYSASNESRFYQHVHSASNYSASNDTSYQLRHPASDYSASLGTKFYHHMHSASKSGNSSTGKMRNYYN